MGSGFSFVRKVRGIGLLGLGLASRNGMGNADSLSFEIAYYLGGIMGIKHMKLLRESAN